MRRICVITGTRADFGLLYPVMRAINERAGLKLLTIVTGMHLSPEFGLTWQDVREQGFEIDSRVEMLLSSDTPSGISKSVGLGVIGMADAFERLKPDIVLVLGDRFEILSAAIAAMNARIPIAHNHGGEATEGLIDEAIRHAVTKMAHLHFATTEPYRQRIIQMGEKPEHVFTVGAPGLDNIRNMTLLDRAALGAALGFELGRPTFLVTFHPLTLGDGLEGRQVSELFSALDRFADAHIIFTKPNADQNGRIIGQLIDGYVAASRGRAAAFTSLGQLRYLSCLKHVDIVIGNSSSGLIEAPHFKVPTVNIGDRQRGRIAPDSVINCAAESDAITEAVERGLSPAFRESLQGMVNPYGDGSAAPRIVDVLQQHPLGTELIQKRFHDLRGAV